MWSSENERLGFRNCCPVGYFLINVSFVAFLASAAFVVGVGGRNSASSLLVRFLSPAAFSSFASRALGHHRLGLLQDSLAFGRAEGLHL